MSDVPYGSPFTALREALCDQFGLEYGREYGCGSPGDPCSCVPFANAIDQAERENAALRERIEQLRAGMEKIVGWLWRDPFGTGIGIDKAHDLALKLASHCGHANSCAFHNAPAEAPGPCDCGSSMPHVSEQFAQGTD